MHLSRCTTFGVESMNLKVDLKKTKNEIPNTMGNIAGPFEWWCHELSSLFQSTNKIKSLFIYKPQKEENRWFPYKICGAAAFRAREN